MIHRKSVVSSIVFKGEKAMSSRTRSITKDATLAASLVFGGVVHAEEPVCDLQIKKPSDEAQDVSLTPKLLLERGERNYDAAAPGKQCEMDAVKLEIIDGEQFNNRGLIWSQQEGGSDDSLLPAFRGGPLKYYREVPKRTLTKNSRYLFRLTTYDKQPFQSGGPGPYI